MRPIGNATRPSPGALPEVPGVKPRSFKLVADVGGPSAGAMAWVGKEDLWGLMDKDGKGASHVPGTVYP